MSDDELLEVLSERARQRWSEQTTALGPESVEGWTPLTDEEQEGIVDEVLGRLVPETAPPPEPVPLRTSLTATPPSVAPAANEAPMPSRWMVLVGAGVAVAAAVLLWRWSAPTIPALPGYENAQFEAGTATMRGTEPTGDEIPRLLPDGELRWSLRPVTAVEGSVQLRLLAQGETQHCLRVVPVLSPEGALQLQGRVSDVLPLLPGEWVLTPIVGRPAAFEGLDDPCAWRAEGQDAPDGVVAGQAQRIRLDPAP